MSISKRNSEMNSKIPIALKLPLSWAATIITCIVLLFAPLQAAAQENWCDVRGTFQADGDLIDLEPVLADGILHCNPTHSASLSVTDDEDSPRPDWVDDWGRLDDDNPPAGTGGPVVGSMPPTPCLNPSTAGFPQAQLVGALG